MRFKKGRQTIKKEKSLLKSKRQLRQKKEKGDLISLGSD
jgi:hypothetical protein